MLFYFSRNGQLSEKEFPRNALKEILVEFGAKEAVDPRILTRVGVQAVWLDKYELLQDFAEPYGTNSLQFLDNLSMYAYGIIEWDEFREIAKYKWKNGEYNREFPIKVWKFMENGFK